MENQYSPEQLAREWIAVELAKIVPANKFEKFIDQGMEYMRNRDTKIFPKMSHAGRNFVARVKADLLEQKKELRNLTMDAWDKPRITENLMGKNIYKG